MLESRGKGQLPTPAIFLPRPQGANVIESGCSGTVMPAVDLPSTQSSAFHHNIASQQGVHLHFYIFIIIFHFNLNFSGFLHKD